MDVLSLYGGRGSPLDDLARLSGFPGKLGMKGNAVWESFRARRDRRDPQLLRGRLRQHLSSLPALPAHALRLRPGALRRGMRPAARRAREARRAALERVPLALEDLILSIDALDSEGRGVARNPEGKVVFVEGALAGRTRRRQGSPEETQVRHRPRHLDPRALRRPARAALPALRRLRRLRHAARRRAHADGGQAALAGGLPRAHRQGRARNHAAGRLRPGMGLPPPRAALGALRRRRAARWSASASGARPTSPRCANATCCRRAVSALILPLRELVGKLSIKERLPQIEVAVADNATVLVFRHLLPLTAEDEAICGHSRKRTASMCGCSPAGPDSAHPFHPPQSEPYYELPEFGVRIAFPPDRVHPGEPRDEPRAGVEAR